jgi:hypothetical protein
MFEHLLKPYLDIVTFESLFNSFGILQCHTEIELWRDPCMRHTIPQSIIHMQELLITKPIYELLGIG